MAWLQSGAARIGIRLLAVWMTVFWSGIPDLMAQSADEQQRAARAVAELQNSLLAIEDGRRDAPRDRWDPQYVVDTVGVDANDLFAWVRGEVRWVPYRGALRGPVGVLMDRVGNSLDQALLLAALLRAAGREVRLAHADLPREVAAQLWQSMADTRETVALSRAAAAPVDVPAAGAASVDPGIASTAERYGFDAAGAARAVDESARTAAMLGEQLDRRVATQSLRLLNMLSVPTSEDARSAASETAFAALRDHWWVQIREGGGWTDLDLLHPSGEAGQALVAPRDTLSPEALPTTETHRVMFRIVAEQLKDGKTQEQIVLERELKPSELIGQRIALRHFPMLWPSDFQAITPDDVNSRMFAALATQTEWLPILDIGDSHFKQASVHDTGAINPKPEPPGNPFLQVGASAAGVAARVADVLSGGNLVASNSRVDAPRAPRAEGELTAEWIEYELRLPGAPPRALRREVFDMLGPGAREAGSLAAFQVTPEMALARSMAMLTETELLILPCRLAPEFILDMATSAALANRDFTTELTSDPFGKAPANSSELVAKMVPLPGPAYGLASLRFATRLDPGTVFVDQPTILAQHAILTSAGPGELAVKVALDIVAHPVGVDPFGGINPFIARIIQGVADTNAEALVLPDAEKARSNTADAFDKTAYSDWLMLAPGDEADIATLGLDPDIAARLAADLRRGDFVVAAKASAGGLWWRIDPATGETLGIGANGWGQALVEYAFVLIIQIYLAQIACMVQASIVGKLEGTVRTAKEAQQNGRKNFNHCLTLAFLGVLNGFTTAYFMNRFVSSVPNASEVPPRSTSPVPNLNKTQQMPQRPLDKTQQASPGGPPPGSAPPGSPPKWPPPGSPSPPPGSRPPGSSPPKLGKDNAPNPGEGPHQADYSYLDQHPDVQQIVGPRAQFEYADAKSKAAYDNARAQGANDKAARSASEDAWWDSHKNYWTRAGASPGPAAGGGASPPPAPPPAAPANAPAPVSRLSGFGALDAAMKGL